MINTGDYADLAVGQIWARELDEGRYLCSMSSMYSGSPKTLARPVKDGGKQHIRRK